MKRIVGIAIFLLWLVSVASAQAPASDPLFSMKRLSAAVGIERESLHDYQDENLAWQAVLPIAYNVLSPPAGEKGIRLSLTARLSQSFNRDEQTELWIGARVTLFRGAP